MNIDNPFVEQISRLLYDTQDNTDFMTNRFTRLLLLKVFKISLFRHKITWRWRRALYIRIKEEILTYKHEAEVKSLRNLFRLLQQKIYFMMTRIHTASESRDTMEIPYCYSDDEGILDSMEIPDPLRRPISPPIIQIPSPPIPILPVLEEY